MLFFRTGYPRLGIGRTRRNVSIPTCLMELSAPTGPGMWITVEYMPFHMATLPLELPKHPKLPLLLIHHRLEEGG